MSSPVRSPRVWQLMVMEFLLMLASSARAQVGDSGAVMNPNLAFF